MTRRSANRQDQLAKLLVKAQGRFANGPLSAVGSFLVAIMSDVQRSIEAGVGSSDDAERISNYVAKVLELLPSSFGDRFAFDSQLIHSLAQEYSQGAVNLSSMLVPKPSNAWGHQTVPMPSIDGKSAYVIDVIHLPGEDKSADIDLLSYPFVCHELGHNILFRNGDAFTVECSRQLNAVLAEIQKQTIGIRGMSRHVAEATIEQVRQYWTPTADQYNWAHEIAIDVISLWLCGPAYLASLQDVFEADGLNPYQLGQSHPPYEIRARALIDGASRLGWAYYTGTTQTLADRWSSLAPANVRTNLHVACGDPRLLNAVITSTLETCAALSLPCCTPSRITAVQVRESEGRPLEFGTEVILSAWLTRNRSTEAEYDEWEMATIDQLLADITE